MSSFPIGPMQDLQMTRMRADLGKENRLLEKNVASQDAEKIKKLSEDFESLFLNIMMKSMRNTVQKSGFIDGGNAEEIYRGLLDTEYAKLMAGQRQTGLADSIEKHMLKVMEHVERPQKKDDNSPGIQAYRTQEVSEQEYRRFRTDQKQGTIDDDTIRKQRP